MTLSGEKSNTEIINQRRMINGKDAICVAVVCLILFKFKISVSPKVEKSGNVLAALEIEVLPDWSNFLAWAFTSSMQILSLASVPLTWRISMPISRANLLTIGDAGIRISLAELAGVGI